MNKWLGTGFYLFVVLCLPMDLFAADNPVRVGAYNLPPYMIEDGYSLNTAGSMGQGVDVDIMLQVLKQAGYEHSLKWMPFKRLRIELMETGNIDVANAFFYDEKYPAEKQVLYDFGGYTVFYTKKAELLSVNNSDELLGLTVGVVRGDSYGKKFESLVERGIFTVEEVSKDRQNFVKLMAGRIDLLAINSVVGGFYVNDMKIADKIKPIDLRFSYGSSLEQGGIYMRFSQQTDQKFVENVREAVKILILDGSLAEIKANYGVIDYPFMIEYYRNQ